MGLHVFGYAAMNLSYYCPPKKRECKKKGIIAKLLFPVKKSNTFTSILKVKIYT